jgi:hypothetical protein
VGYYPYFAELFYQGVKGPDPVGFLNLLVQFCEGK